MGLAWLHLLTKRYRYFSEGSALFRFFECECNYVINLQLELTLEILVFIVKRKVEKKKEEHTYYV